MNLTKIEAIYFLLYEFHHDFITRINRHGRALAPIVLHPLRHGGNNLGRVYYLDAPKFTQSPNTQRGCIWKMINLNCKADGNLKPSVHVVLPDGKFSNKLTIELKKCGLYRCQR